MEHTTSRSSTTEMPSAVVKQADGSNILHQHARGVKPFSVSPQLPWWSGSGDATLTLPCQDPMKKPCQRGHANSVVPSPSLFSPLGGLVSGTGSRSGSVVVGASCPSIDGHMTSQLPPSSFFPVLSTSNQQAQVAPPMSSSLVSTPSSGFESAGVGYRSHSIHGHVAMSQSLPSFFFPELGTVDLQALPSALGGQMWQGMAPPPSGGLFAEHGSRSGSVAVGDSSLSVHGHVTSSQSLPSSFSCTLGHGMVDLQAPAATPFPASLGDLPWQGLATAPQPSWTDLGLPACPSQSSAALEQIVACPPREMSSFSPAAVSGQLSSNYELPPLPPSLRIPPLGEASTYSTLSTITGGTMPWHYADSSSIGGAGSSIHGVPNLTAGGAKMKKPMPPLEEASMYASMGAASSIPAVPNLTAGAMKMKEPMSPPPSRCVGAGGSSNFIGFAEAQPSMKSELAALRAGLQAHLLPVKQELICKKEADELDQDAIQHPMPDNSMVSWDWDAALKMPVLEVESSSRYNGGSSIKVAGSTPAGGYNSNSTLKLLPSLPSPALMAAASSTQSHVPGVIFTDAEKEIIRKDKGLQNLVNTDPKKARSKVLNRLSAAKRKAIRDKRILELECMLETLEWKRESWSAKLQLVQEKQAELETHNKEICMMVKELEQQSILKDAVTETQKAQIQNLKNIIKLNAEKLTDGSASHMNNA